jgi:peptidyl-prolyl cis-trans isomerase D
MLKRLRRKKTAKWVWIILAILILPAFVFWGFSGFIQKRQEAGFIGKIFGRKISSLEFKEALDAVRNQAIMQFGESFDELAGYLNLESSAWERLILLSEAKRRKITASDREVIELIQSYPFFQKEAKFSPEIYSEVLKYVFRTQPRIFEEQIRQNIILSKFYEQVTQTLSISDEEIRQEFQKAFEEISVYYIASNPGDSAKDIEPAEEEIRDYFSKNSLQFKEPVSFNLEYAVLDPEDKYKDLVLRLRRRGDFAKVLKDMGLTLKETGLFSQTDPIPGIGWSPEILNAISELKIGQISQPIKIDKNYYLLRLKERNEPYIPKFEKIKDRIRETVIKERAKDMAKEKIDEVFEKLKELESQAKPIDFEKIAKDYGLKYDSTNLFKFASYIEGIGASDTFWITAQGLKEGGFSQVISMPQGFFIIKLKSRTAIDEDKFESQKEEFSKSILQQKKHQHFSKFVEELKRKAQGF